MKNEATKLPNMMAKNAYDECKILIEKSKTDKSKFDIHIYLEGVLEKAVLEVPHYQVESPFGNDAE